MIPSPTAAQVLIDALEQTVADGHLSRAERTAFHALAAELAGDAHVRSAVRARAFAVCRSAARDGRDVLEWLEDVVQVLDAAGRGPTGDSAAYFSPGEDCRTAIAARFGAARTTVDVCVFTITDDRLAEALLDAHRRGVRVRLVSDNEKIDDPGSDVRRLSAAGVPVAVDRSPAHMHHKFAIFDDHELLTGSYNWTRSAFLENQENLIMTRERAVLAAFQREFERLWSAWSGR